MTVREIRRIAEKASHKDEVAILALLALCERQHEALVEMRVNDSCSCRKGPCNRCMVNIHEASITLAAGRAVGLKP